MKQTKIITRAKHRLQSNKKFAEEYEYELDQYINNGYEIKSSNITSDGNYMYFFTILQKEDDIPYQTENEDFMLKYQE